MANQELKEILQEAKALISQPGVWIQNSYALDSCRILCNPLTEDAAYWCAWGAIAKASREHDPHISLSDVDIGLTRTAKMGHLYGVGKPDGPESASDSIVSCNDYSQTKLPDIIKMIDDYIIVLDQEGDCNG